MVVGLKVLEMVVGNSKEWTVIEPPVSVADLHGGALMQGVCQNAQCVISKG